MEQLLIYVISGIGLGALGAYLYFNKRIHHLKVDYARMESERQRLIGDTERQRAKLESERLEMEALGNRLTGLDVENSHLLQQIRELKEEKMLMDQRLTTEFENIAHRVLTKNADQISQDQAQRLTDVLNPLKEKMESFERKVGETYEKELRDKLNLGAEVRKLYELNQKISVEANNLTKALKGDVKKMGNWGELILERVLEQSGLTEGREFQREVVTRNSAGHTIRPDVIVFLPDEKHVIIDSKVSMLAYEKYVNAVDEADRMVALKDHVQSVRKHINDLGEKNYSSSSRLNTPDFVLMFMPVEASFAAAIEADHDLFSMAWDKKIVPVSPSTLLATLRTIASIWKQENQNKNAMEIARQSGDLYDKLVGFIADIEKIGRSLEQAQTHYGNALGKLSTGKGNLVGRAEKIRALGAKNSKQMPSHLLED